MYKKLVKLCVLFVVSFFLMTTNSMVACATEETETEEEERAVEDTAYFQMRQRIAELLEAVTEGEAALLKLRFGLEGGKPLSPEETGARLGMTPGEVVAMEAAALAKLRNSL